MYIERVQIEEGFLDGLDVKFTPGLNTIIGARGTGKSSLLELIRFCLGSRNYTDETKKRSHDHALSVLAGGQITVTLRNGDESIVVTRTAEHAKPDSTSKYSKPVIFSQSEIESVGLQASGRLKIIDNFGKETDKLSIFEEQTIATVLSQTAEIEELKIKLDVLENQISQIAELEEKLKQLSPKEKEVSNLSADAQQKTTKVEKLSKKLAILAVENDRITRALNDITDTKELVAKAYLKISETETFEEGDGELHRISKQIKPLTASLKRIHQSFEPILTEIEEISTKSTAERKTLNQESRVLRQSIEELQKGAGIIVRDGQKLRERLAQLLELKKISSVEKKNLKALYAKRNETLDELDNFRARKFEQRRDVETRLNEVLGPQIRIEILQAGQSANYNAMLTDALKGSGLQYKTLVPKITESISPRELLEITDNFDSDGLSDITGISADRAAKIISTLNDADLGEIATIDIEDTVNFSLLDGGDYKDFLDLSTGQRCTVILPLILEHKERIIIIDQPEDHIDNAFITSTLIKAILRRSGKGQVILTTHNANIPVLGEATHVLQLASDGSRGFEVVSGSLDDTDVIEAISTVMEGGADAFKRRAEFYELLELI